MGVTCLWEIIFAMLYRRLLSNESMVPMFVWPLAPVLRNVQVEADVFVTSGAE